MGLKLLLIWLSKKISDGLEMSVISIQCGSYANYVGTHFWNLQVGVPFSFDKIIYTLDRQTLDTTNPRYNIS